MDEEIVSLADNIISILKQRKIVELSDLVKETGADEKNIKLIISLLEKEEMVDVGYSLTKVLISWNDEADRILMKMKKNQKIISLNKEDTISLSKNGKTGISKQNIEKHDIELVKNKDKKERVDIESPKVINELENSFKILSEKSNSQNVNTKDSHPKSKDSTKTEAAKRESSYRIGAFAVKDQEIGNEEETPDEDNEDFVILDSKTENILKHTSNTQSKKYEVKKVEKDVLKDSSQKSKRDIKKEKEIDKEIKEIERSILINLGQISPSESSEMVSLQETDIVKKVRADSQKEKGKPSSTKVLSNYRSKKDDQNNEEEQRILMRQLEDKLNEIVNKRAEISELNKEKTILYDTHYPEIKSKVSTEISALDSILNEKEGRISEIRNRISTLPNEVDELSELLNKVKETQEKLNQEFSFSFNKINDMISRIKEARSENVKEFGLLRNQIIEQEKELNKLMDIYSSLNREQERISNSINFIKEGIARSQAELVNLEGQLEEMNRNSKSIEMKINGVSKQIKLANKDLEASSIKIRDLDSLNAELNEIKSEYEKARQLINEKIKDYEQDILALRKSLQLEISSRYLSEIEKLSLSNQQDMNYLLANEDKINNSIEQKKRELLKLMDEAKELHNQISSNSVIANDIVSSTNKNQISSNLDDYYVIKSELGSQKDPTDPGIEIQKLEIYSSVGKEEKVNPLDKLLNDLKKRFKK
jgi:chromosome segregation ATPase